METLQTIFTRKSTRKFSDKSISNETIQTLLKAAMSGPTCVNSRPWEFIVVNDKNLLNQMADANGRPAEPLRNATLGILVCGNLDRTFKPAQEYWVVDCSIAIQNMILAAQDQGVGSVWLGTWPQMERVKAQQELFNLPDNIIPHSLIAFGYPLDTEEYPERNLLEEDKVHFNKW